MEILGAGEWTQTAAGLTSTPEPAPPAVTEIDDFYLNALKDVLYCITQELCFYKTKILHLEKPE